MSEGNRVSLSRSWRPLWCLTDDRGYTAGKERGANLFRKSAERKIRACEGEGDEGDSGDGAVESRQVRRRRDSMNSLKLINPRRNGDATDHSTVE